MTAPKKPSWEGQITKEPVVLFPPSPHPRPLTMAMLLAAILSASCATLHRHPGPIGTPSPEACFASQQALDAWVRYVEPYIRATLEAQEAHSCAPPAPMPQAVSADVSSASAK